MVEAIHNQSEATSMMDAAAYQVENLQEQEEEVKVMPK